MLGSKTAGLSASPRPADHCDRVGTVMGEKRPEQAAAAFLMPRGQHGARAGAAWPARGACHVEV